MSEMPARIWVERSFAWAADRKQNDGVAFVRADIAERMAEALEKAEQLYQVGLLNASDNLAGEVVELRRSALSAWKDGR